MGGHDKAASTNVGTFLAMAEGLLTQQRVASPRRIAEMLMAHVLGVERYRVRLNVREALDSGLGDQFLELVRRRMRGEPVQYLVGCTEFMSLPFKVSPAVLIPRPETEILVEATTAILASAGGVPAKSRRERSGGVPGFMPGREGASSGSTAAARMARRSSGLAAAPGAPAFPALAFGNGKRPPDPSEERDEPVGERKIVAVLTVLDLGTGSGAIAISLAHYLPRVLVYATDASPAALTLARENAKALRLDARVRFLQGDLFGALDGRGLEGNFAAIVANPPYIPSAAIAELPREVRDYEPPLALDGGPDGLDVVRRIVAEAPRWLRPGGVLAFEVGAGQAPRALALLRGQAIWRNVRAVQDLTSIDRVVLAERVE